MERRQADAGRIFVRTGRMDTSDAWRSSLPVFPVREDTSSATSAGASALGGIVRPGRDVDPDPAGWFGSEVRYPAGADRKSVV